MYFVFESQQIQNLQPKIQIPKIQKEIKPCKYSPLPQRNYLRLIFYGAFNMDEQYSSSEFYYPKGFETSDVKTETGIRESQEAIDDFINKEKKCKQII